MSVVQCQQMLKEIKEDEKTLQESPEDCDELHCAIFGPNTTVSSPVEAAAKLNRRHGKVGKRLPKRDPIEPQKYVR